MFLSLFENDTHTLLIKEKAKGKALIIEQSEYCLCRVQALFNCEFVIHPYPSLSRSIREGKLFQRAFQ
jgi:hypothetical protein